MEEEEHPNLWAYSSHTHTLFMDRLNTVTSRTTFQGSCASRKMYTFYIMIQEQSFDLKQFLLYLSHLEKNPFPSLVIVAPHQALVVDSLVRPMLLQECQRNLSQISFFSIPAFTIFIIVTCDPRPVDNTPYCRNSDIGGGMRL